MRIGLIGLVSVLFSIVIGAQSTVFLKFGPFTPKGRQLRATIDFAGAGTRSGAYGYVRVNLENVDREAHSVRLVLGHLSSRQRMYRFSRQVDIGAGGKEQVFLPLPNGDSSMQLSLSVDGFTAYTKRHNRGNAGLIPSVLFISDDPKAGDSWEHRLKGIASTLPAPTIVGHRPGGRQTVLLRQRVPQDLPPRWDMLSGFDALIVDGRSMGTDKQAVLRKYLRAGGRVCVYYADVLPDGPLGKEWQGTWDDHAQWGTDGFGFWLAIDSTASASLPGGPLPAIADREFKRWLGAGGVGGFFAARERPVSGPILNKGFLPQKIPGLGDISLRLFFLFTLVFGVLVGPVSYFYWWRKRKLPMLLMTVPVMGFGCTAIVLLYGLLSEGLGVKGVIRSLTILDQREHEAVTWSSRTLYAGLAPGALQPAADTYLGSLHLNYDWNGQALHQFHADFSKGRALRGGLVPSRYQTCLVTAGLGTVRERLRIQRREDGDLDLLSTPDFQVVPDDGDVLLRDFDGQYYISKAGRLVSLVAGDGATPAAFRLALKDLLSHWDLLGSAVLAAQGSVSVGMGYDPPNRSSMIGLLPQHESSQLALRLKKGFWTERVLDLHSAGMAKGSYVALVQSNPCVDELGLEVDWLGAKHLVLGSLSKEDVVE